MVTQLIGTTDGQFVITGFPALKYGWLLLFYNFLNSGSARPSAEDGGAFTENLKWRSEHPGTDAPGLLAEQAALLREQDAHLDQLGSSITRLKQISHRIGGELGDQVALLDEFSGEMTRTESRLDNAMRRAARLLHIDSSRAQWFVIGVLLLTLLVILILFVVLWSIHSTNYPPVWLSFHSFVGRVISLIFCTVFEMWCTHWFYSFPASLVLCVSSFFSSVIFLLYQCTLYL